MTLHSDNRFLKVYEEYINEKKTITANGGVDRFACLKENNRFEGADRFACLKENNRFESLKNNNYGRGSAFSKIPPPSTRVCGFANRTERTQYSDVIRTLETVSISQPKKILNPIEHFPTLTKTTPPLSPIQTPRMIPSSLPSTILIDTGIVAISYKDGKYSETNKVIEVPVRKASHSSWAEMVQTHN